MLMLVGAPGVAARTRRCAKGERPLLPSCRDGISCAPAQLPAQSFSRWRELLVRRAVLASNRRGQQTHFSEMTANRQCGFAEAEESEGEPKMMPGVGTEFRDDTVINPSAATAAVWSRFWD